MSLHGGGPTLTHRRALSFLLLDFFFSFLRPFLYHLDHPYNHDHHYCYYDRSFCSRYTSNVDDGVTGFYRVFFFRLSALVRVPLAAQLGMIFLGFFFVEFQVRYLRTATVD